MSEPVNTKGVGGEGVGDSNEPAGKRQAVAASGQSSAPVPKPPAGGKGKEKEKEKEKTVYVFPSVLVSEEIGGPYIGSGGKYLDIEDFVSVDIVVSTTPDAGEGTTRTGDMVSATTL